MVTVTYPEAPLPTVATMVVPLEIEKPAAGTPPILTPETLKASPTVRVICDPLLALVGVKEVIVGGAGKIKINCATVPLGVVTLTLPVPPVPTTALIRESETTVKEAAGVPAKETAVAPVKPAPVMETVIPVTAVSGEMALIWSVGI